jgi:hypothetical protein
VARPARPARGAAAGGYLGWSRDPAVGLFAVLPLWLVYEGLRLLLAPHERNGAEVLLLQELDRIGWRGLVVLRAVLGLAMLFAARSLIRRDIPWLRVAAVVALEGTVYGLLLGPTAAAMTNSAARLLELGAAPDSLIANLVGSLGAGLFEELVFRLGLMSLLAWAGMRLVTDGRMSRLAVGVFAVLGSAVVFSWFHHFCGEPFEPARFLFRTMAGILLGLLMWLRGFGVCVYTHTLYDVHYYLVRAL